MGRNLALAVSGRVAGPRRRLGLLWLCAVLFVGATPAFAGTRTLQPRPDAADRSANQDAAQGEPQPGTDDCLPALHEAEKRLGTPPGLLERIAMVESGRMVDGHPRPWPWTINAEGLGVFFGDKAAAVAGVQRALARGAGLIDVGCMQVNLQMHPGAFRSLEEAFDPVMNADYAAGYLRRLFTGAGGDWDEAAGLYHSHTPWLAEGYRQRLATRGHGRMAGVGGSEPLYARVREPGMMRLPTVGGRGLLVNVNRQPGGAGRRRATACQVAAAFAPDMAVPLRVPGCLLAGR